MGSKEVGTGLRNERKGQNRGGGVGGLDLFRSGKQEPVNVQWV